MMHQKQVQMDKYLSTKPIDISYLATKIHIALNFRRQSVEFIDYFVKRITNTN